MSKNPEQYHQHVSQVIAAEQLIKEGAEVHAGNSVKFIFTHSKHKKHERRVRVSELIEKGVELDTEKYLLLLYSAAANLLSFSNYAEETIKDSLRACQNKKLESYS